MSSLLFIQFANSMFPEYGNEASKYYDCFYKKFDRIGYWKGEDFFEVPKWIGEVSYLVPEWDKELYVAKNIEDTISYIKEKPRTYVLMSLMDCNKDFIEEIVKHCPETNFILGGYNEDVLYRLYFENKNVEWAQSTKDEAVLFQVPYRYGTDYSLFDGFKCIPRLTLSDGCLNKCAFCTVPHGAVTPRDTEEIYQQLDSFKHLEYKLIYIDDKTFGQCSNWKILADLTRYILIDNPGFEGFIVQTTAPMLRQKGDEFAQHNVRIAEIGMETYNDEILRKYRKPSSCEAVDAAIDAPVSVICNVVVGFPEETQQTYDNTATFLIENMYPQSNFIGINPAIYTDYSQEESGGEVEFVNDPIGLHQRNFNRICTLATNIVRNF